MFDRSKAVVSIGSYQNTRTLYVSLFEELLIFVILTFLFSYHENISIYFVHHLTTRSENTLANTLDL